VAKIGNHDWLLAMQRKRLRFLRFSFTQRTQRNRLRLNGNWALFSLIVDYSINESKLCGLFSQKENI